MAEDFRCAIVQSSLNDGYYLINFYESDPPGAFREHIAREHLRNYPQHGPVRVDHAKLRWGDKWVDVSDTVRVKGPPDKEIFVKAELVEVKDQAQGEEQGFAIEQEQQNVSEHAGKTASPRKQAAPPLGSTASASKVGWGKDGEAMQNNDGAADKAVERTMEAANECSREAGTSKRKHSRKHSAKASGHQSLEPINETEQPNAGDQAGHSLQKQVIGPEPTGSKVSLVDRNLQLEDKLATVEEKVQNVEQKLEDDAGMLSEQTKRGKKKKSKKPSQEAQKDESRDATPKPSRKRKVSDSDVVDNDNVKKAKEVAAPVSSPKVNRKEQHSVQAADGNINEQVDHIMNDLGHHISTPSSLDNIVKPGASPALSAKSASSSEEIGNKSGGVDLWQAMQATQDTVQTGNGEKKEQGYSDHNSSTAAPSESEQDDDEEVQRKKVANPSAANGTNKMAAQGESDEESSSTEASASKTASSDESSESEEKKAGVRSARTEAVVDSRFKHFVDNRNGMNELLSLTRRRPGAPASLARSEVVPETQNPLDELATQDELKTAAEAPAPVSKPDAQKQKLESKQQEDGGVLRRSGRFASKPEKDEQAGASPNETKGSKLSNVKSSEQVEAKKTEKVEAKKTEKVEAKKTEKVEAKKMEKVETKKMEKVEAKKMEKVEAKKMEQVEAKKAEQVEAKKTDAKEEKKRGSSKKKGTEKESLRATTENKTATARAAEKKDAAQATENKDAGGAAEGKEDAAPPAGKSNGARATENNKDAAARGGENKGSNKNAGGEEGENKKQRTKVLSKRSRAPPAAPDDASDYVPSDSEVTTTKRQKKAAPKPPKKNDEPLHCPNCNKAYVRKTSAYKHHIQVCGAAQHS